MSKITAIETAIPSDIMPNLVLVRVHTEDGLIGCGETYYTPHAIEALIHDWMASRLLGAQCTDIESHWRFLSPWVSFRKDTVPYAAVPVHPTVTPLPGQLPGSS